jgi:hypothetical protein
MSSWRAQKKGELIGYLIGFIICTVFLAITTIKMMETLAIQQEISNRSGIPIFDPYVPMFMLFALVPTLYFLGRILRISNELNRSR